MIFIDELIRERSVERERIVPTSVGDVRVSVMTWAGYKKLKSDIMAFIGERLAGIVTGAFSGLPGGVAVGNAAILSRLIPALTLEINDKLDSATIDILIACGVNREVVDQLLPIDILDLRSAASEINQMERLFEAEKNLLGGLVAKALKTVGFSPPSLRSFGGPVGSPSSPEPDGSEAKSSEPQ